MVFISRSLAIKVLSDFEDIEASLLAGLMHDMKIMVLDNIIPRDYANFLILKGLSSTDKPLELLEEEEFAIVHPQLGAGFMEKIVGFIPKSGFCGLGA